MKMKRRLSLTGPQIIILGFLIVIIIGSCLLCLPFATRDGQGAPFPDALFTSTSAVCVTGLVVHDTASYWSPFGQAVILLLIQTGGMGVLTLAVAVTSFSGKKISLKQRSAMQESVSAHQVGGIVSFTGFILKMTAIFELAGTALMLPVFIPRFGIAKGIWYSVFHSISAFCNAGFDLMGAEAEYSSLTAFRANPVMNIAVMLLIVIGGIGFLTWQDIGKNKLHFKRYRMQTKVILTTSALLIAIPALLYFLLEFGDMPIGERIWASLFQSVTARTAGFNTADLTALSGAGLTLMIALMLVGGSPGSTAGGLKTTTLAVMLSTAFSVFRHRGQTNFFGRRIDEEAVRQAASIVTMYLALFIGGGCAISRIEGLPLKECLFETASAIGTVGLTLGITPSLGSISRAILIALMYFGRVGGLTIIFAAVSSKPAPPSTLPQEKITVG